MWSGTYVVIGKNKECQERKRLRSVVVVVVVGVGNGFEEAGKKLKRGEWRRTTGGLCVED